ncbi:hypothetical protein BJX99DRAFT_220946 [Aspergillus californicus]
MPISPTMFSTHRQPPPPIPPSPTLSNPDMILPFDENERENSTPSPPFNLPSLSHLQSFYQSSTNYNVNGNGNGNGHTATLDPARNSSAPRAQVQAPVQKKAFPRHTWMHEGHDAASRRLSDIGEEDGGSPYRHGGLHNVMNTSHVMSHIHRDSARGSGSPSSPRRTEKPDLAEMRTRSSSSSSTISGASEASSLDEAKGRTDYVASQEGCDRRAEAGRSNDISGQAATTKPPAAKGEGPDEGLSSAILESEAERILENAKRRLTLMEGNLTRARSSMRANTPTLSPSPAPSASSQSAGLGQPVGGLYQSIHRAADRRSSLRPRQTYTAQDASNNRHSRVYSETNLPTIQPIETNKSRSVSAMGSSSSSNFNTDDRSFHYAPTRAYLTHRASVSSMQRAGSLGKERVSSDSPRESEISDDEQKISNIDDFNTVYPVLDPPSRSQSQLQVRDLQDQMKGLHIKISTLKVKAQEDNLRRRSLQSLRTPSPLTAASHWYANPLDPTASNDHLHPNAGYGHDSPRSSQGGSSGHTSSNTDSTLLVPETIPPEPRSPTDGAIFPPFELTDHEDEQSVSESLYEDAEEGTSDSEIDREALEEILREPLDEDLALEAFPPVPQHHDDTPHEEREDAFDYEHFILHSALGNYTQARMRRQSNGSDTSVETTRPIRERRSVRHSRTNSTNSVSTVASFATAAEGSDDVDSVLYWDRKFNDELNYQYVEEDHHPDFERPDSETLLAPRKSRLDHLNSERPDSAATGSATPTSLASSLVSTVRAAASPYPNAANSNLGINEDDTRLLENLFKSLGDVCMELQELTTVPDYDEKQAKLLRRRLEAARRVLDGELD